MLTRDQLHDLSMTLGDFFAGRVGVDAVKRLARMVNDALNQCRKTTVCDGAVTVHWIHSELPDDQSARCVMLKESIKPTPAGTRVMDHEQLRHWLAMHCPENAAEEIWNRWYGGYPKQGKTFIEWHGVEPTIELARYTWADRMLYASCVQLREVTSTP